MTDYTQEFNRIIFGVSTMLGNPVDLCRIEVIDRGLPHIPKKLKPGTMGVYTFEYNGRFLKIGKAGPSSNARFLSQHYNHGSAPSTLAASILADKEMEGLGVTASTVGTWIKENCRRIDIMIDTDLGIFTLELIEAILHFKYEPKYEGFIKLVEVVIN